MKFGSIFDSVISSKKGDVLIKLLSLKLPYLYITLFIFTDRRMTEHLSIRYRKLFETEKIYQKSGED